MAAEMGLSPEILETGAFSPDKVLEKTQTVSGLMERLRGRYGQHKSWADSIKAIRLAVVNDKRLQAEALEKSSLQNCLDKLHRAMKITNQQSFIERLDLISRQLGMIFTPPSHPENQVILSSDMFKVVILLDGQSIKDVRIRHQETPSSCEDMVEALSKGDFEEFVSHLQGLLAIYSIQGDRKQKIKGYLALSSLESDLNQLAQLQSSINGVANYIHKSPLGILLPRRGGHPMKLIYYVSPYDLLCKNTNSSYPMTVEAITEHGLGHSVTVSLEPCPHVNKLQTMPLMSVRTSQDGKSLQSFQNANTINSCSLSASFVLVLPQPLPLAKSVIDAIKDVTGLDVICDGEMQFLSLLLNHCSNESLTNKNELFVTLPDQQHVYVFNNSADGCLGQPGALVSKIPFTLPTCVPKVLNLLRQQLMFNSVIHSLIRPYSKKVYKSGIVFEVTAISLQYLSLMFEHPLHHSMITVDFDLSDITSVKCNVNINNRDEDICSSDYVSRAFQRCFSIPVALRSVIKRVNEQVRLLAPPKPVCKPVVKSRWTWSSHNVVKRLPSVTANNPVPIQNNVTSLPNPPPYSNTENWAQSPQIEMHKYSIQFNRFFSEPAVSTPEEFPEQRPAANPLLATLLDNDSPGVVLQSIPIVNESPMLSKLLEENTSVASNPFPAPTPNPRKRLTKRKSSKDISGKSPKHRISDSEMAERTINSERQVNERHGQGMGEKHIDLDSSGGSYEEMPRPSSVNSVGSTGAHSTGSIIDLTDIGESHVKKLENSLDSIMGKESPRGGAMMNMVGHPMNNQLTSLDLDLQFGDFHHSQHQHSMLGDGAFDFTPHPPWPSRQTPPTPTSRNSPHHGVVPKNEKTSTSLEELLLGPGGRENEGPNPAQPRRNSQQQRRSSLKRQNSLGRNSIDSSMGVISPDVFSPLMTSPSHHPLASPSQFPIPSPNYIVSPGIYPQMSPSQNPTVTSPNLQNVNTKNELSDSKIGILGSQMPVSGSLQSRIGGIHSGHITSSGKPSLSMLKAQLDLKNDVKHNVSAIPQVDLDALKEDNSNSSTSSSLKLKLSSKRHFDSVSLAEIDETKRSSTFDFHSDDEDFTLPRVEKMTVVSSSPTRLQISNKSTLASFNRFNKSEKYKRKQKEKELKLTLSVDSGKRKRERDESRKEKKKKKLANNSYSVENERALYKSTTVVENIGNENDHYKPMPKLKITKEGVKLSIENSVLHSKDVKSGEKSIDKIEKAQKEAIVKIEKMDKSLSRENSQKDLKVSKEKTAKHRDNNKSVEKDKFVAAIVRTPSTSDEGIFDKINAMKTEHLPKNGNENHTPSDKNSPHNSALKKSSSSSKLVKSHKSQRSSSSKSDSKVSRTPTIKLKPIVVTRSPNSCGLSISKSSSNPGTPCTPKSVTQSPTSTTIGKIGAVSLATSGSQKQLHLSNNKSPLGSANKLPTMSKPSPVHSSMAPSKSSSSLQKNIQIQGPSGKNSPVLHSSNKSRSSSASSSSSASGLKSDKSLHKSLSSSRTSSPHSDKEKSKSRSSSSSSRDREKSSSKSTVPTSTVITQETAASVLSFLNPNKIAKLPPIPKLSSSTSGGTRVSTPTSTSNPIVTSPSSSTTTTVTTNSKLSKGVTSVSKSSPSSSNATSLKSNTSNSANVKTNHYNKHEKGNNGNQGNSSRSQNHNAGNTAFSNRNSTNSPQSFSNKSTGALNKHEKGSNPSSGSNSSSAHRNNYNSASSQNRNSNSNSSGGQSQWGSNSTGSSQGSKLNHSNVSNQSAIRGSNSGYNGNKGNHSSDNTGNRTVPVNNHFSNSRGSNSIPNAPKGPGPPPTNQDSKNSAEKEKVSGNSAIQSPRARKGSLSAVIDKLTCKAAVPANENITLSSQKVDQVIVNESPASPELEPAAPVVQEDKKIVIFEAPASPEPESSVLNTPKNHVANSSNETVSIPLENESGRSNMNDFTNERTKESLKRQDSAHLKSRSPLSSSQKVIPLNSPKEKTSSNKIVSSHKKGLTRQNSVDIINSIEKQNGELDENHGKSVHISISSSVHSVSNSSNQDAKVSDIVFKIPTPKTQDSSYTENITEDIENYIGHRNHRINSNSKLSDSTSPPSSPENGLIIDFPSSPRHLQNKTNSPQCNSLSDSITDSRTSPNFLKSPGVKGTPGKDKSGLGSSASSPECLEDDLMDEALGFGN